MLVTRYRDDALRLARRLAGRGSEAEDLAQTAVWRVLRRAPQIREPLGVRAYLLTTVRNVWRNELRARDRRLRFGAGVPPFEAASPDAGPEERACAGLDAEMAGLAFASLPGRSRRVIWLRFVEQLGYEEISRELGITAGAARQRVHRARRELVSACDEHARSQLQQRCRATQRLLPSSARNMDDHEMSSRVAMHLSVCPSCRGYAERLGLFTISGPLNYRGHDGR